MIGRQASLFKTLQFFPSVAVLLMLMIAPALAGESAGQKRFASPQQAADALAAATRDNDDAELLALFGPDAEDLVSSGDPVADQYGRSRFLQAYTEKHRLETAAEGKVVLFVGSKDYPFPIPVVARGDAWFFDTEAGKEEILNRRIGRNELHTLEVMQAYTDAQREYACMKLNGGTQEFAQKLSSSQGKKDGLYWPAAEGEKESPFGPLIARAIAKGYEGVLEKDPPEPFQGYYYKILKGQGPHADGGAFEYVADGKMVLGFALVAYPARYGASGIMTFTVNQAGVIYEKDLGEGTAEDAGAMTVFDPDETWARHEKSTEP
jgi:hypothetical protein